MVFMGNTQKSVAYRLKHSHFYEPLPDQHIDSASLDRIHAFNPGWEVSSRDQTGFEKTFSGMECRRRVREQILRIDDTFKANEFTYRPLAGGEAEPVAAAVSEASGVASATTVQLKEKHLVVPENAKGWSYRRLLAEYLQGCSGIIIRDRGLDLFQWFEFSPFNAAAVMQEAPMVKGCEISSIRTAT